MTASIQIQCAGAKVDGQYVLPEMVRVPCDCPKWGFYKKPVPICPECHGLGWTPATNGWAWWRAVDAADITVGELNIDQIITVWQDAWGPEESDPETAFFQVLYRALEAIDAVFLEVADASN